MEKHNFKNTSWLILFLMMSNYVCSQNKTIVPVSGTMVFVKEEKLLDKDMYLKSFKALIPKMKKAFEEQIVLENLTEGKLIDTTQLKLEAAIIAENMQALLPFLLEEERQVFKFHHEFKDNKITKYITLDNQLINNEIFIDRLSGSVVNEYDENIEIERKEIIKITEFKNEVKEIRGFECFKVIYTYNEPLQSDFDFLSSITTNIRELWVTEQIKCKYHPVINESEILEKYYPLEIIEYSEEINGFHTLYKVDKMEMD